MIWSNDLWPLGVCINNNKVMLAINTCKICMDLLPWPIGKSPRVQRSRRRCTLCLHTLVTTANCFLNISSQFWPLDMASGNSFHSGDTWVGFVKLSEDGFSQGRRYNYTGSPHDTSLFSRQFVASYCIRL